MKVATSKKNQQRKQANKNISDSQEFKNAVAVSARYAMGILEYLDSLDRVINVKSNLTGDPIPFFTFTDEVPHWYGYTICFDFKGYPFRLYFGFQYRPDEDKVEDLMGGGWPDDVEPRHVYRYVSNYWVQLNKSKNTNPHGGDSADFLIRFDAEPDHREVSLFPHHRHYYYKNKSESALDFNGSRDELLDYIQDRLEAETVLE